MRALNNVSLPWVRGAQGALVAGVVLWLTAGIAVARTPIAPAPAFNSERLSSLPRDEWITNGGNLSNQRFSPLTRINRDNVTGLRGVWRAGLGSGASPGNSAQAQILVYEGVLYVINGDNDVFAIEVETGDILWRYAANTDPRAGNPFGRSSRGEGGGASLHNRQLTAETAVTITAAGRNNMPSFRDAYSIDELYDVATYIVERLNQ